jgi:hypothetical protein
MKICTEIRGELGTIGFTGLVEQRAFVLPEVGWTASTANIAERAAVFTMQEWAELLGLFGTS